MVHLQRQKEERKDQDTQIKHLNLPEPKPNLIMIDPELITIKLTSSYFGNNLLSH